MKIYIMADIEGICGVTTFVDSGKETNRSGPRYEAARLLLTKEVNAAVQGAIDGGAADIIVNDAHGDGSNFVMDLLHSGARYLTGSNRTEIMGGLDKSFAGVMLIGYHAMSGAKKAVMDHTVSTSWRHYYLNGIETGEIGQMAAVAGCFDVPVILVTGDQATTLEAKKTLGDIEALAVKEGCSRTSAICLAPVKARELIREAAKNSLSRVNKIQPYKIKTPIEIRLECISSDEADKHEACGSERIDAFTVKRIVESPLDILKI